MRQKCHSKVAMIEFINVGFFLIQDQHKFNNWDNDYMDYCREGMEIWIRMSHQMCHSGSGPESMSHGAVGGV